MQDCEFTVEDSKVYFLQTRSGKRTAAAAVKIAMVCCVVLWWYNNIMRWYAVCCVVVSPCYPIELFLCFSSYLSVCLSAVKIVMVCCASRGSGWLMKKSELKNYLTLSLILIGCPFLFSSHLFFSILFFFALFFPSLRICFVKVWSMRKMPSYVYLLKRLKNYCINVYHQKKRKNLWRKALMLPLVVLLQKQSLIVKELKKLRSAMSRYVSQPVSEFVRNGMYEERDSVSNHSQLGFFCSPPFLSFPVFIFRFSFFDSKRVQSSSSQNA